VREEEMSEPAREAEIQSQICVDEILDAEFGLLFFLHFGGVEVGHSLVRYLLCEVISTLLATCEVGFLIETSPSFRLLEIASHSFWE
jgi:hypothetical protein